MWNVVSFWNEERGEGNDQVMGCRVTIVGFSAGPVGEGGASIIVRCL